MSREAGERYACQKCDAPARLREALPVPTGEGALRDLLRRADGARHRQVADPAEPRVALASATLGQRHQRDQPPPSEVRLLGGYVSGIRHRRATCRRVTGQRAGNANAVTGHG